MGKKLEVFNVEGLNCVAELKRAGPLPFVSVSIPLRDSGVHVNRMLESLFKQDYPADSFEIVIGVPKGDSTSSFLNQEFRDNPRIRFVESEIPAGHKGRNANFNRNAAAEAANGDILAYTDAKTIRDPDWISKAVLLMALTNAEALGGLMLSTPEQEGNFLAMYTNGALFTRVPQFGEGYFLELANSGRTNDFPVTSCFFVTKNAYLKTFDDRLKFWGFPPAEYSYEDFMFVQSLLDVGVRVFCTSQVVVYHKHRTELRKIIMEYARSGLGAAQMYEWYPHAPFARARLFQVNAVTVAFFMGFITLLYAILYQQPEILVALFSLAGVVFAGLGIVNAVKVRHWYGLFFPLLTAFFIVVFAAGFNLYHRLHMADPEKFLQTVLSYNWNMEL